MDEPEPSGHPRPAREAFAEFLGTGLLLVAIVGSGIAAQRLTADVGLQLLINAAVTGAALAALIATFAGVSGAHFNPVVTLVAALDGVVAWSRAGVHWAVQLMGAVVGAVAANLMFSLPWVTESATIRSGAGRSLGEVVATFGLVIVIIGVRRRGRTEMMPWAIGAYVFAAIFFTSSASFANPAVTVGRTLSASFTGIAPSSAPLFILAQFAGGLLALLAGRLVFGLERTNA